MKILKGLLNVLGILIIICASIIGTYFILMSNNVIKRDKDNIEITIADESKVYDDTKLSPLRYDIVQGKTTLDKNKYKLDVTFEGSQTDVGVSSSKAKVIVLDSNGYDVTSDFNIKINSGKLEVTKRKIKLKVDDVNAIYNGEVVTPNSFSIVEGELLSGHSIQPIFKTKVSDLTSSTKSEMEAKIYNYAGKDVSDNYSIECLNGNIVVGKASLSVSFEDYVKEYDGENIDIANIKYYLSEKLDGVEIGLSSEKLSNCLNAGDYVIDDLKVSIINNKNNINLDNYELIVGNLNVSIEKKKLDVIWDDTPLVFNDEEQAPMAWVKINDNLIELNVEGSVTFVSKNNIATATFKNENNDYNDCYTLNNNETLFNINKVTVTIYTGTYYVEDFNNVSVSPVVVSEFFSNDERSYDEYFSLYSSFLSYDNYSRQIIVEVDFDVEGYEDYINYFDIIIVPGTIILKDSTDSSDI